MNENNQQSVVNNVQSNVSAQTFNNQVVNNTNQVDEDKVLRLHRKVKKLPFILMFLLCIGVIAFGVYMSLEEKNKYDNYVVIGADLFRIEKKYQAGVPYYLGIYRYKVDGKKYDYKSPQKYDGNPDLVIQIRYNPENPNELYNRNQSIMYIGITAVGVLLFFITFGVLISMTSKKEEKIVVAVVYDNSTCVGGRKFYLKTVNLDGTDLPPEKTEYYSYFTDKVEYFPTGRKVKFNLFKYNKSILTENYNGVVTIQINNFKITDFIFL